MTVPASQGAKTEMLVGDWTGQLARERVAEFHRQAERQRLVRLARARRGGSGGVERGRRWLAAATRVGRGPGGGAVDRASQSVTVGDAVRSS